MSKIKTSLKLIKEILLGAEIDFTTGSIKKAVFLLAVPMVLEMVMESVFVIVDIFFVSKLGNEAVTAVGITESVMTLVYALASGLAVATTALVSRRIGEKNTKKAASFVFQAILTGIIVSVPIMFIGLFYSDHILRLMGADENVILIGSSYTEIMFIGNSVIILLFIMNAAFRGSGDAIISMVILGIANLINIILDPILIFGFGPVPAMGVKGAAIATTIGRGIGVLLQLYILFFGTRTIKLTFNHVKIKIFDIFKIIRLSFGSLLQNIIATTSWIFLVRIMAEFGSVAVAGYTIAIRIVIFALLPAWGMSNAASTLVGQNLGAKLPDRAMRSVWVTGVSNVIFLGIIGIIMGIFSDFFVRLFIQDGDVIKIGSQALRYISFGFIAYALGMVLIQSFNGAGDTYTPMYINVICFWFTEIPLAYFLAIDQGLNERGVFISVLISETLMTLLSLLLFRRGKWKLRTV
jgi:putative MATE family efflux protein